MCVLFVLATAHILSEFVFQFSPSPSLGVFVLVLRSIFVYVLSFILFDLPILFSDPALLGR